MGSDLLPTKSGHIVADIFHCPWYMQFDAIICDPPYLFRTATLTDNTTHRDCGIGTDDTVLAALCQLAMRVLVVHGRLVFWWHEESTGDTRALMGSLLSRADLGGLRLVGE